MTVVHELCSSRYQCLTIVRRGPGVVQLYEGETSRHQGNPCQDSSNAAPAGTSLLLVSENATADVPLCPFHSRHSIYTGATNCLSYFRSACSSPTTVDIVSACSSRPGLELECLRSWTEVTAAEGEKQFFVATLAANQTLLANCFSIRQKADTLLFSVDAACNAGVPQLLRDRVTYVMAINPLPCDTPSVTKLIGNVSSSSSSSPSASSSSTDERRRGPTSRDQQQQQQQGSSSKLTDSTRQSRERKAWQIAAATASSSAATAASCHRCPTLFVCKFVAAGLRQTLHALMKLKAAVLF
jgi:hypothetical protein